MSNAGVWAGLEDGRPPDWPFAVNQSSQQYRNLTYWWPFDFRQPDLIRGVVGSVAYPPTLDGDWKNGVVSRFTGSTTKITLPTELSFPAPWTVMIRAKRVHQTSLGLGVLTARTSGIDGLRFEQYPSSDLGISSGSTDYGSGYYVSLVEMEHLCWVQTTANCTIYVNGVQKSQHINGSFTLPVKYLFNYNSGSYGAIGTFCDLRFYSGRAMTQAEVLQCVNPTTKWELVRKV